MKIRTEKIKIGMDTLINEKEWLLIKDLHFDYIVEVYFIIGDIRKKASQFSWSITTKTLWVYKPDLIMLIKNNNLTDKITLDINYMSLSEERNDKLNKLDL